MNSDYFDFQQSRRRDRVTGVDSVKYTLLSSTRLTIEDAPVRIINVNLFCDLNTTNWCITPEQRKSYEEGALIKAKDYLKRKTTYS